MVYKVFLIIRIFHFICHIIRMIISIYLNENILMLFNNTLVPFVNYTLLIVSTENAKEN